MGELDDSGAAVEVTFEVHGARAQISASDAELFAAVTPLLPPEAVLNGSGAAEDRFALLREDGRYRVVSPWDGDQFCRDRELALAVLEGDLHFYVATRAPSQVFIHAGVVAHRGSAIVIPGPSLSGKTTLVAALVKAGALYFSDEMAFLDKEGLIHPYARPLAVRGNGEQDVRLPVERLGGVKGTEPVRIGVLAVTTYKPGGDWKPQHRSRGQGILALFANMPLARERPAETMALARRALGTAVVLESDRGEADVTAAALMEVAESVADG